MPCLLPQLVPIRFLAALPGGPVRRLGDVRGGISALAAPSPQPRGQAGLLGARGSRLPTAAGMPCFPPLGLPEGVRRRPELWDLPGPGLLTSHFPKLCNRLPRKRWGGVEEKDACIHEGLNRTHLKSPLGQKNNGTALLLPKGDQM